MCEAKKQISALTERLQATEADLSNCELRRAEVETQIRETRNVGYQCYSSY